MIHQLVVDNNKESIKKINKLYNSGQSICVFLHSNNCGPCKMFSPVWDNTLNILKKSDMHFVKIEVGKLQLINELAKDFYDNVILKMLKRLNAVPNVGKYNPKTNRISVMKKRNESDLIRFITN